MSPNNQSILNRHYSYDKAGNISLIKSEQGETSYQYDNLDRLIQVTPSNELISKGHKAEAYSYDAIGNRTGSIGSQWTYNQLGQLSQWGEAGNQTTLSYSANGHLTHESRSGQEREYHYNAADRLASISQNGTEIASYQYDPFGRRISKTVNGETRYYIYTDEGLIAELDQTGQMQAAYGWAPDSDFGTSPLWQADIPAAASLKTAAYHYLITDHLGTPQLALDSTGQIVWQMQSDAFGNTTLNPNNQITLNLRFAGQYYDAETGLSYNYYRDYDSRTGRYIESDPLGLGGGINTFAYVGGNPLSYADPYGLVGPLGAMAGAAAVVFLGVSTEGVMSSVGGVLVGVAVYEAGSRAWDKYKKRKAEKEAIPGPMPSPRKQDRDQDKTKQCEVSKVNTETSAPPPDPKEDNNCKRQKENDGAKQAKKMSKEQIGDLVGNKNWHDIGLKKKIVRKYSKQLRGSTNFDFYRDKCGNIYIQANNSNAPRTKINIEEFI